MVLLPAILASLAMMFVIGTVALVATLVIKGGFSWFSIKCKIKKWPLLWVPFVFGWFEGGLVSCFLWKNREPKRFFQVIWFILHCISFIVPIIYYITYDPASNRGSTELDLGLVICLFVVYGVMFIKTVFRTIAILRGGKHWAFIFVGIFASPLWPYVMVKEGKKLFVFDKENEVIV